MRASCGDPAQKALELVFGRKLRFHDAWPTICETRDIFRQAMIGLRTQNEIDGGRAAAHLLALGLRDAAGHADDKAFPRLDFSFFSSRRRPSSE